MDGVEVTFGTGIPSGVNDACLLCIMCITYDIAQAHLKYLQKLKFSFETVVSREVGSLGTGVNSPDVLCWD